MEDVVCRVCRSAATPESPLRHPCNCKGSMRWIHQHCLLEWLDHKGGNGNNICEICGYKFEFVSVYKPSTPSHIPPSFVLYHIALSVLSKFNFYTRVAFALLVWLFVVPWITIWIWRLFFDFSLVWDWLLCQVTGHGYFKAYWNMTFLEFFGTFLSDIFEGQIIASLTVIAGLLMLTIKERVVLHTHIPHPPQPRPLPQELREGRPSQPRQQEPQELGIDEPGREKRLATEALSYVLQNNPHLDKDDTLQLNHLVQLQVKKYKQAGLSPSEILIELKSNAECLQKNHLLLQKHLNGPGGPEADRLIEKLRVIIDERTKLNTSLQILHDNALGRLKNELLMQQSDHPVTEEESKIFAKMDLRREHDEILLKQITLNNRERMFALEVSSQQYLGSSPLSAEIRKSRPVPVASSKGETEIEKLAFKFTFTPPQPPNTNGKGMDDERTDLKGKGKETLDEGTPYKFTFASNVQPIESQGSSSSTFIPRKEISTSDVGIQQSSSSSSPDHFSFKEEWEKRFFERPRGPVDIEHPQPFEQSGSHLKRHFGQTQLVGQLETNLERQARVQPQPNPEPLFAQVQPNPERPFEQPNQPPPPPPPPQEEIEPAHAILELLGIRGPLTNLLSSVNMTLLIIIICILFAAWIPYNLGYITTKFFVDYYLTVVDYIVKLVIGIMDRCLDLVVEVVVWGVGVNVGEKVIEPMMIIEDQEISRGVVRTGRWKCGINQDFQYSYLDALPDNLIYAIMGYMIYALVVYGSVTRGFGGVYRYYFRTLMRFGGRWVGMGCTGLKFVVFISFELAIFPAFCGALMHFCALPMLGKPVTVASMVDASHDAPYIFWVMHWVIGTSFMFRFAVYVSQIRQVLRNGVLWFVRDPNDPNFQPINEILNRPVLHQMRKLAVGVVMYSVMVLTGVGVLVLIIVGVDYGFGWMRIFPLDIDIPPISDWYDFPIQLILFKLFIFYFVIDQIKSRIPYQSLFTKWFHTTARILRISSFLIGGEHPDEESDDEDDDETPRRGFRYMRVPRTDHIPIVPGQRVLVPMREGEEVQGREGESEDEVREFWTCVYVPAHFKLRLVVLFLWHWICQLVITFSIIVVPLMTGRFILNYIGTKLSIPKSQNQLRSDILFHDTYSYTLGLAISYILCRVLYDLGMIILARGTLRSKIYYCYYRFKRMNFGFNRMYNAFILTLCFGIIIPILLGYIPIAFRHHANIFFVIAGDQNHQTNFINYLGNGKTVVSVWLGIWFSGMLYMRLIYYFMNKFEGFRMTFNTAFAQGLDNLELRPLMMVFVSVVHLSLAILFFPMFYTMLISVSSYPVSGAGGMFFYTIVLAILVVFVAMEFPKMYNDWINRVKDEQFLVGRRLVDKE